MRGSWSENIQIPLMLIIYVLVYISFQSIRSECNTPNTNVQKILVNYTILYEKRHLLSLFNFNR